MGSALRVTNEELEIIESFVEKPSYREKKINSLQEKLKAEKAKRLKFFIVSMLYGVVFMAVGAIYVNFIMAKTQYNMNMARERAVITKLNCELEALKTDLDRKIDLAYVEEQARVNLGMEVTDKIKYIKIK